MNMGFPNATPSPQMLQHMMDFIAPQQPQQPKQSGIPNPQPPAPGNPWEQVILWLMKQPRPESPPQPAQGQSQGQSQWLPNWFQGMQGLQGRGFDPSQP